MIVLKSSSTQPRCSLDLRHGGDGDISHYKYAIPVFEEDSALRSINLMKAALESFSDDKSIGRLSLSQL